MEHPFWIGLMTGLFLGPFVAVLGIGFLVLGLGLWKGR